VKWLNTVSFQERGKGATDGLPKTASVDWEREGQSKLPRGKVNEHRRGEWVWRYLPKGFLDKFTQSTSAAVLSSPGVRHSRVRWLHLGVNKGHGDVQRIQGGLRTGSCYTGAVSLLEGLIKLVTQLLCLGL
jgi:hypothetical protein